VPLATLTSSFAAGSWRYYASHVATPETVTRQDGVSAEVALEKSDRLVQITLGITRILEQESLEVSVWGSPSDSQIMRSGVRSRRSRTSFTAGSTRSRWI
jgi:hypothetical protein